MYPTHHPIYCNCEKFIGRVTKKARSYEITPKVWYLEHMTDGTRFKWTFMNEYSWMNIYAITSLASDTHSDMCRHVAVPVKTVAYLLEAKWWHVAP